MSSHDSHMITSRGAFIPWPTIPAILGVVIPLLILWSIFFSPKAVIKLRLRTRLLLIHIIYLIGA